MCGITGIFNLKQEQQEDLFPSIKVMNELQTHRGPDGEGIWMHPDKFIAFAHKRLSIIDLSTGDQPMRDEQGHTITYNGEIYNYIELREQLRDVHTFKTTSDTEVILASYKKWGVDCVNHLRGMFAFALWDENERQLFCARDRFGIKPFYFTQNNDALYFASECKSLVPFLNEIETDEDALKDYLFFQLCLAGKTLFKGISELMSGHRMIIKNGNIKVERYWEVYYELDWEHTPKYFEEKLKDLLEDSVKVHVRSDVPVGAYVSGGYDSSIIAAVATRYRENEEFKAFTGLFSRGELYDESMYAQALTDSKGMTLHKIDMTHQDFENTISKVIYHLDYPVAGPGSFPQYMVSQLASEHRKVVLGGQGGDEIFGGYTRYLIAYFEQCIKGAIDNSLHNGNYVVTYDSIIPNLVLLKNYQPMLKEFWKDGLFEDIDRRYFRLINRAPGLESEINWKALGNYSPFDTFKNIFDGKNVGKESYFDKMTHFDFKTLLPALLQVEDRMSMAHGLESRVPFLDHPIVEFAATMPSNIKFKNGTLKMALINAMKHELPDAILNRKNKMGFPVPLNEWINKELKDFVFDTFNSSEAKNRPYMNNEVILKGLTTSSKFSRKIWGLLSLEIWHKQFHDQHQKFKNLLINQKQKITI